MTTRKRYADSMQPSTSSQSSPRSSGLSLRRSPSSSMSQPNKRSRTYATNAHSRVSQGGGMSLHVLSDIEALEALGLETDNPVLRVALANTQNAMKELIALSHDTQADLDARASGVLCAMLDGVRRHQSLVQTPAPPDTAHFDDELSSPKMTLKRRLEIYGCISKRTAETLASLEGAAELQIKAAEAAETSLRSETDRVQAYIDSKSKLLRQKQAEHQDRIDKKIQVDAEIFDAARKHFQEEEAAKSNNPIARLTGGSTSTGGSDMLVSTQSSQGSSQGSFVGSSAMAHAGLDRSTSGMGGNMQQQPGAVSASAILDLLLEPPPSVAQKVADRRTATARQKEAEAVLNQMILAVQFAESLRKLLQAVKTDSDTKLSESQRKARQYRAELKNRCVQSLMHHVPLLGSTAVEQVGSLHSRQIAAGRRLEKKKLRLADNEELFGDEAPMARADLEKRISEYEGIVVRAKGAVRTVAQEQLRLWKSLLNCAPSGGMEAEANGGGNRFTQMNAHGNVKTEKYQKKKSSKKSNNNGVNDASNAVSSITGYSFDLSGIVDTTDDEAGNDNDDVDLDDAVTIAAASPVYGSTSVTSSSAILEGHQNRARDEIQRREQREKMEQLDHLQRTRFLPDQVLGAMQSALKQMREQSADNDLIAVPHVMLPIISRLAQARIAPPTDPQAQWHNTNNTSSSSQFTNSTTSVGIAAPAAADGPSPQQNEFSFSNMGQVRVESRESVQNGRANGSMGGSNGSVRNVGGNGGFAPSYLVPPVGMDATKRGEANDMDMENGSMMVEAGGSVHARAAKAEKEDKCAIM